MSLDLRWAVANFGGAPMIDRVENIAHEKIYLIDVLRTHKNISEYLNDSKCIKI